MLIYWKRMVVGVRAIVSSRPSQDQNWEATKQRREKTVCICLKDDDLDTGEWFLINALLKLTNKTTKQPNSAPPDPYLTLLFMPSFCRLLELVASWPSLLLLSYRAGLLLGICISPYHIRPLPLRCRPMTSRKETAEKINKNRKPSL